MAESHLGSTQSRRTRWIFVAVAAAVYAAGVSGFVAYGRSHGDVTFSDALYFGFQLFTFASPQLDHPQNLGIEVGRWGALVVSSLALLSVLRRMFGHEWATLRFVGAKGHILVGGPDEDVLGIARALQRRGSSTRLAIWATSASHSLRLSNALVLHGDIAHVIQEGRILSAAEAIITGPQDVANFARASAITTGLRGRDKSLAPLLVNAQIDSTTLRESLRRLCLSEGESHSYVRTFSPFETAVRQLLTTSLPLDGKGIALGSDTQVQLVVIGDCKNTTTLVLTAARLGHFANGVPIRIVAPESSHGWRKDVAARLDALTQIVEVVDIPDQLVSAASIEKTLTILGRPNTRNIIAVVTDSDSATMSLFPTVMDLAAASRADVSVCLRSEAFSRVMIEEGHALGVSVVPFGWLDDRTWANLLEDDDREQMAKIVHLNFQAFASKQARQAEVDGALRNWGAFVREEYKESNRLQVDHISIKLRAVGCEVASRNDPREPVEWSTIDIDTLSRMEHARWMAERRLGGWRFAPGPKDEVLRTSPGLVTWDNLEDSLRRYDRDAIKNIPSVLESVGNKKICAIPVSR